MRRLALAALPFVLLSPLVLLSTGAEAGKKTYCERVVAQQRGSKVVRKENGVTVYTTGRTINACSDKHKFAAGLSIMDPGYKITEVEATNHRCLAVKSGGKNKLDQILSKDLAGKEVGSTITIVGFGNPKGTVGSMAVSKNCALGWGESVTDAAGTTTRRIRLKGFGAQNSLQRNIVNEIATVEKRDDVKHVAVKAKRRKVKISWTESGRKQSRTLP
jgi:hypothetical protein